jgi:hypothetical protein
MRIIALIPHPRLIHHKAGQGQALRFAFEVGADQFVDISFVLFFFLLPTRCFIVFRTLQKVRILLPKLVRARHISDTRMVDGACLFAVPGLFGVSLELLLAVS